MGKLTLNDLLARKEQREAEKIEFKKVYVPSMEGELELKKLPLTRFLGLLDGLNEDMGAGEAMRAQLEVIYEFVPLFHNKELQDAYECVEPTEIVAKIFNDNLSEINLVLTEIFGFYGMDSGEIIDSVKN